MISLEILELWLLALREQMSAYAHSVRSECDYVSLLLVSLITVRCLLEQYTSYELELRCMCTVPALV
jgi:hypothetical protein